MMWSKNYWNFALQILSFLPLFIHSDAWAHYNWVVKEATYTRLCSTKKILTVNGKFPGPVLRAYRGDTIYVNVHNGGRHNITIHWHGVRQPRNPWSDGPEYITQCPIQPGGSFNQKIIFSTEEGTLWWHAHSDWSRATVHGAIYVYPKPGTSYPFPKPHAEIPIILDERTVRFPRNWKPTGNELLNENEGEWWKQDVMKVFQEFVRSGGPPNVSDAYTINGQPGDLYPCSKSDTFKLSVEQNKTYLLRIVNAIVNEIVFLAVANHNLTVVATDASYTKPIETDYITISPGQSMDVLMVTNQQRPGLYYMAARAYNGNPVVGFDTTTTTAIVEYNNGNGNKNDTPLFPYLPGFNDTARAFGFFSRLKSLPVDFKEPVPKTIDRRIISTIAINTFPCQGNQTCQGPNGTRLAASMNNISFVEPNTVDILVAYYYYINGVFKKGFPNYPPYAYNFTGQNLPLVLQIPKRGTKVKVIEYGTDMEVVFQNTNLVGGLDHPMHLHGFDFYIIGTGFGNFDEQNDPKSYNLVDPPLRNTVTVPISGWAAIRFKANNPGVWYLHCHFDRHLTWGMDTVFIVNNGKHKKEKLLPPPPDMPPCY